MRISALGFAALAAGCMAEPPLTADPAGEAAIAAETEGRIAGSPVSCVPMRDLRGNRSVGNAIVFDGPGDIIYVNRPPAGGCSSLRYGRSLMVQTTVTQLCRGDLATVVDYATDTTHGSCGLGDFVPYGRRAR